MYVLANKETDDLDMSDPFHSKNNLNLGYFGKIIISIMSQNL